MPSLSFPGRYPRTRLRRNRADAWSRRMVAESRIAPSDLIWPIFVIEGKSTRQPVDTMPGVDRLTVDLLGEAVGEAKALGIPAVALFPQVPDDMKSEAGEEAFNQDNLMCRAIAEIKAQQPEIGVIADVALDPYTSHGHDGILHEGRVLNDETVKMLVMQALTLAEAGADIVAPSDMMDGRIGAIRESMDSAGLSRVRIMSYAAKYASCFYGPFRDAIGSATVLKGDKKTYQMDPANGLEALREAALDLEEGADMIMVKPGLSYLDIVQRLTESFGVPTFAFHVSGEYAMMKAAAEAGWLDYDRAVIEVLTAFKRAGCNGVLTYAALDAARLMDA